MHTLIKAIVCDLFDVLLEVNSKDEYQVSNELEVYFFSQAMFNSQHFREVMIGRLSEAELWKTVALNINLSPFEGIRLAERYYSMIRLNNDFLVFLRTLRPHYKIAILSNASSNVRDILIQQFHLDQEVDKIIISADEGMMKPELEIFIRTANILEAEPEEILFIDDEPFNLIAAQKVGMRIVQFKNTQEVIARLKQILGG